VAEEDNPEPERASGKALVVCEKFLKEQKDLNTTILRLAGLVGGDRKAGRFLAGKKDLSNAKAPVNLIHRDDCIQIISQILQQNKWGLTLNAAADEHPEKANFYKAQTEKLGLEPPTFQEQNKPSYKIVSNQKLKQVLNYTFLHPDPMDF
jgi:nucleoside-diphosphate-sugar epimerase